MISEELASKIYRRLDESPFEIRVLCFLPPRVSVMGDEDAVPIECTLKYVKLESKPLYNALSYTWKDHNVESSRAQPTIVLDGHEMPITRNLWLALARFQKYAFADGEYFAPFPAGMALWVDAVCINQTDNRERNHQVRHMRQIYQNAECINIWLGPEFEGSSLGMDLALELEQDVRALGSLTVPYEWINPLMRSKIKDPEQKDIWEALSRIHRRPYWRRLWIVQEIVSNLQTYVHIGPKTTHLMPLLTTGQAIFETEDAQNARTQTSVQHDLLAAFESQAIVADRISFCDPDYEGHDLLDLLRKYRHHHSSNPRDKVYGLAGLAKSYNGKQLPIDYDLPVSEVFQDTALYIIDGSKELDIICSTEKSECDCGGDAHRDVLLPSWVPNWNCVPKSWSRMKFDTEIPLDAALKSKAVVKLSSDHKVLRCRGLKLGSIERMHRLVRQNTSWQESVQAFHSLLKFLYGLQSSGESPEALAILSATVNIPKTLWEIFFTLQSLRDMAAAALPFEVFQVMCADILNGSLDRPVLREHENNIMTFFRTIGDRSVFVTHISTTIPTVEVKSAVGACPPCAQEGDEICLIYGCKTLVNLRKDPRRVGKHTMVSVSLVNGYMYGEAMERIAQQDFEIV
jgi:hypothetical protein